MKEEDIIKDLFSKTELNYPTDGIEEAVLKKLALKRVYKKQQKLYRLVGKIGLSFFMLLSLLFSLIIEAADTLYLFLGTPFILLLLMFFLEILWNPKITKQA